MIYNIAPHQTEYNGCTYRSRLEATWAAFFDLNGWSYLYEPFELSGWVPDFIILGAKENVLVEVKPFTSFEQFEQEGVVEKVMPHSEETDILLLGLGVWDSFFAEIGWIYDHEWHMWEECSLDKHGFFSRCASFRNRITGEYDGDHHLKHVDIMTAKRLFNTAHSKTMKKYH